MIVDADLGATLDPAARDWLNRLAVDLAENGFLTGRFDYLAAGRFPGREDADGEDVVVRWATRVVPFRQVRRVYDADHRSIIGWGEGRLTGLLCGVEKMEPAGGRRATIDRDLARRLRAPSRPAMEIRPPQPAEIDAFQASLAAGTMPELAFDLGASRPLALLTLDGPRFRRLCSGVDVPAAPLRRNLETEPRLHGPGGVVRWNDASLVSAAERAALSEEIADRAYTLLLGLAEGRIAAGAKDDSGWSPDVFQPGLRAD